MRALVLVAALLSGPALAQAPPAVAPIAPRDEAVVNHVMDDWHDAAARADGARYFSHFAPDGVFLGTDATERWTVEEFRVWSKPYFDRGKAWSFKATKRNVSVVGDVAWFDETLDTPNMGPCRGSGVLRRIAGRWKISQYNLSIPIPNDLTKAFVKEIGDLGKRTLASPTLASPTPTTPTTGKP